MPCRIASEVHINGNHVAQGAGAQRDRVCGGQEVGDLPRAKSTRVVTAEGHEVVGVGYST
jgi:hypothetical protein